MDTDQKTKQALKLKYKPKGRRIIGCLKKRWKDQHPLESKGTGTVSDPSKVMMLMTFVHNESGT
jgi:hypothetical protein